MATKIMLVEDDINLSEIYKARLEAEGYTIISAKDGEEALALAVKEHPELIISDVMMPKISGFDMLDILRGTEGIKNTKIIIMTALGQTEDKARADKLGADRYLVKSQVTLEDVVKTVHEVLGDQADGPEQAADVTSSTSAPMPNSPTTSSTAAQPTSTEPAKETPKPAAEATNNPAAATPPASNNQKTEQEEQSTVDSQIQTFASQPATAASATDDSSDPNASDKPAPDPQPTEPQHDSSSAASDIDADDPNSTDGRVKISGHKIIAPTPKSANSLHVKALLSQASANGSVINDVLPPSAAKPTSEPVTTFSPEASAGTDSDKSGI